MDNWIRNTQILVGDIDGFLDNISKAGMQYKLAVSYFLKEQEDKFQQSMDEIGSLENSCDELRREIRYKLYSKMLIPESRGDVLSIIENIDSVIDCIKMGMSMLDGERPEFPPAYHDDLLLLAQFSSEAVSNVVSAARAFFREVGMVNDAINKVLFYEHEADKIEQSLIKRIFTEKSIERLSHKIHLREFIGHLSRLSDESESVCERISVAAIKRSI